MDLAEKAAHTGQPYSQILPREATERHARLTAGTHVARKMSPGEPEPVIRARNLGEGPAGPHPYSLNEAVVCGRCPNAESRRPCTRPCMSSVSRW